MKFETRYEVTIHKPIDEVLRVLALPEKLEQLLRLSPMVTSFTLLGTKPGPKPSTQIVSFEFGERVPVLPGGRYYSDMTMKVEQTVDVDARRVDYRSRSKNGVPISIHKVRTFETIGGSTDDAPGSTRVSEVVYGEAPLGLHLIARRTARKAHIDHMNRYARLFEGQPAQDV